MGNKTSRRKSDAKVPAAAATGSSVDGPTTRPSSTAERPKSAPIVSNSPAPVTRTSCVTVLPNQPTGAIASRFGPEAKMSDVKVYRSYSNVNEASLRRSEPRPDIRVYRRSTTAATAGGLSQTLPRGFGRSRSTTGGSGPAAFQFYDPVSTLPRVRSTGQYEIKRQSTPGLYATGGLGELKAASRKSASTSSMASIGYKVSVEDFPDTPTIKRRLTQFEKLFTRSVIQLFSSLPDTVQLSALSVAVRQDRPGQHVSLADYLSSQDIPIELAAADDGQSPRYLPTVQPAMLGGMAHVKRDRAGDRASALSLAGQLVACAVAEAAAELARIFEYQIALLTEGLAIELAASQAAHCVIDYMRRSGRLLDRNTIVLGVARGQHVIATGVSPKLSVIIGQRELKWELHEIFKKPGLRRELFLFSTDVEVDEYSPPWSFFTSSRHDPMLYGYRALMVEWNYTNADGTATYRLNGDDEAQFTDEADARPDDFHRTYCPYRRLVGAAVVDRYRRKGGRSNDRHSMSEFVNALEGEQYGRDQIQVVFRPIDGAGGGVDGRSSSDVDDLFQTSSSTSSANWNGGQRMRQSQSQPETFNADLFRRPPAAPTTTTTTTRVTVAVAPDVASRPSPRPADRPATVQVDGRQPEVMSLQQPPAEVGAKMNGAMRGGGDITGRRTTVVTETTIVRCQVGDDVINGLQGNGGVNMAAPGQVTRIRDLNGLDRTTGSEPGYVIEETTRRTIRSDL